MNINRNNCESFFLDYYEKNLSPVEVAEVLFFLEENTDKKEIFEQYEPQYLEHIKINFPDKNSLKKKYNGGELEEILSSNITLLNYEQFFVASAEGVLTEAQSNKLNAFLSNHPDLKNEFELFKKCTLTEEQIVFEDKTLLKKDIVTAQNREEYFIRAAENDLSLAEQRQLDVFLKNNPTYIKEAELFKQTVLVAEPIVFENKAALKKKQRKPIFISIFSQQNLYYAAAASVILLAGLFFFLKNDNSDVLLLANKSKSDVPAVVIPAPVVREAPEVIIKEQTESTMLASTSNDAQVKTGNVSANKKSIKQPVKNATPEFKTPVVESEEAPLLANNSEEKIVKLIAPENTVALSVKPEIKDSSNSIISENEAVVAVINTPAKDGEYQTFASAVNKKLRALFGIQKSTECEASDKIELWDVAMAGKRQIQKIIGSKNVDVEKVCDSEGKKVEYVFAAGNFSISKTVPKQGKGL